MEDRDFTKFNAGAFIDYYIDEYNSGDMNESNYAECASYLEGLLDASQNQDSDARCRLQRCINVIRGGKNVIEVLKRCKKVERMV